VKFRQAPFLFRILCVILLYAVFLVTPLAAQSTPVGQYHESTSGLEKLTKDMIKAQKENNGTRAEELLASLVLLDYQNWYLENFDEGAVDLALPQSQAPASVKAAPSNQP
jgi:hypothetical protein